MKSIPDNDQNVNGNKDFTGENAWILDDLRRSGLDDDTIALMGVYPVTDPKELKKILGFSSLGGHGILRTTRAYAIPYPGLDDFIRVKLDPPLNRRKYLSPKGHPGHPGKAMYCLPYMRERLSAEIRAK